MMEEDETWHNQVFNALANLPQRVIFDLESAIYYKSNRIRQTDEAGSRRLIAIGKILHELMPEEVTGFDVRPELVIYKWPGYNEYGLNTLAFVEELDIIWGRMPTFENRAVYALAHNIPIAHAQLFGAENLDLDAVFAWWRGLKFDEKLKALRHAAER